MKMKSFSFLMLLVIAFSTVAFGQQEERRSNGNGSRNSYRRPGTEQKSTQQQVPTQLPVAVVDEPTSSPVALDKPAVTNPEAGNVPAILRDDTAAVRKQTENYTPIAVLAPQPLDDLYSVFSDIGQNGVRSRQFGGINSFRFLRYGRGRDGENALMNFIQSGLITQVNQTGQFKGIIPATGHSSAHLSTTHRENNTGKDAGRYGQHTWTTARIGLAPSVGILEIKNKVTEVEYGEIVRVLRDIPGLDRAVPDRIARAVQSAADRTGKADSEITVVGILFLHRVDLTTREIQNTVVGVASVTYKDFSASRIPGRQSVTIDMPSAGALAHELVMAALHAPETGETMLKNFLERRGQQQSAPVNPKPRSAGPSAAGTVQTASGVAKEAADTFRDLKGIFKGR